MKNLALHWQILLGMVAGVLFGIGANMIGDNNTEGKLILAEQVRMDTARQNVDALFVQLSDGQKVKRPVVFSKGPLPPERNALAIIDIQAAEREVNILSPTLLEQYEFLRFVDPTKIPQGVSVGPGSTFVRDWIKPFGTIFINLLKLIAIPLIFASLIKGVSDLKDISKLSAMGGRTIGIYILTTVVAVILGLLIVNLVQPGDSITDDTRLELMQTYAGDAEKRQASAENQKGAGPLQALVDIVPSNIIGAATSNGNMLQIIFFALFFAIGMILIPEEKSRPVKAFFDSVNEVVLKLIDLIMLMAPYGVFALLAAIVVESPSADLFIALGWYALCVVTGLAVLIFVFYPTLVKIFTGRSYASFLNGISPAQLLAFSTSSSAATLPVTMERVQEHLGVEEEVTSFVLPIGATINMDGTSLYQAVAAVFIAQAFGMDLSLSAQLGIIVTATLASIGSAAVPGAGMVMLVIVLGQAGIPEAGLALIFAVDRPLDMCRTVANVTGDACVSMLVAKSVDKLGDPQVKNWDDHYPKENV